MSLFFISIIVTFTLTVNACKDNLLWKDRFGWTCRDYERDPLECNSKLAVSVGGIDVFWACCACEFVVDRRRDYSTCLSTCSAEENACEAECAADKAECVNTCNEDYESSEDPGGVSIPPKPTPPNGNGSVDGGLETWVIILIVVGILVFLCVIGIVLCMLCMPQAEGSCQDDECTQQPMLVGGDCDTPCDTQCEGQYNHRYNQNVGAQMATYGQVQRYP